MQKKSSNVQMYFEEYLELRKKMSHDEAMTHFDYLHPVTLARLNRLVYLYIAHKATEASTLVK